MPQSEVQDAVALSTAMRTPSGGTPNGRSMGTNPPPPLLSTPPCPSPLQGGGHLAHEQ